MLFLLSGVALIALSSAGYADSFSGACTGSANGRNVAELTRENPLVLKEHSQFAAQGTAGFAGPNDQTTVSAKFEVISGVFGVSSTTEGGTGNEWQSSTVNVDDYFKYTAGLYEVKIAVSGPTGSCEATVYVKLDANPLTKPAGIVAGITAVIGLAGAAASASGGSASPKAMGDAEFIDEMVNPGEKKQAEAAARKDADEPPDWVPDGVWLAIKLIPGCGKWFRSSFPFGGDLSIMLLAVPVFGMGAGGAARSRGKVVWSKKVRVPGHPVLGFIAGLLGGLGAVVLVWQYGVWTLQIWNVVGIPVLIAVLAAIWAKTGRVYRIEYRRPRARRGPGPRATAAAAPEA